MLIAAEKGAELIVSVGSHFNLVEFLDKNRRGMSSTFLTRLRVGEILVDAKGVSRLYRPRPGAAPILLLALTGLLVLVAIVAAHAGPARRRRPPVAQAPGPARHRRLGPRKAPPDTLPPDAQLPLPRPVARRRLPGARDRAAARRRDRRQGARLQRRAGRARLAARRRARARRPSATTRATSSRSARRSRRAAYPALVGGRLAGRRIALIELGGPSDRMWNLTKDALQGSGARLDVGVGDPRAARSWRSWPPPRAARATNGSTEDAGAAAPVRARASGSSSRTAGACCARCGATCCSRAAAR